MLEILKKNAEKKWYFILFTFFIAFSLLVLVVFKNDQKVPLSAQTNLTFQTKELDIIKKFLFSKLNSPFINVNYEIEKGDNIEKILKKYNISNQEIQKVIKEYKKYSKPNRLLTGNKVEIIVKKKISKKNNSILKFSIPVSKSTTIDISKNEIGKIESKKIITKLYKKKILAENIILNNLYSSALKAKINPDTIIEFARIFGFEVDFQRDIRKGDWFEIYYEKFLDDNGIVKDTGKIIYASMYVNNKEINLYNFKYDNETGYYDIGGKSIVNVLLHNKDRSKLLADIRRLEQMFIVEVAK